MYIDEKKAVPIQMGLRKAGEKKSGRGSWLMQISKADEDMYDEMKTWPIR